MKKKLHPKDKLTKASSTEDGVVQLDKQTRPQIKTKKPGLSQQLGPKMTKHKQEPTLVGKGQKDQDKSMPGQLSAKFNKPQVPPLPKASSSFKG